MCEVGLWIGLLGCFVWVGLVWLWVELIILAKEGRNIYLLRIYVQYKYFAATRMRSHPHRSLFQKY